MVTTFPEMSMSTHRPRYVSLEAPRIQVEPPEAGDPAAAAGFRCDFGDFGLISCRLRATHARNDGMVEATGIEPATPCLQSRSSTN